MPSRLSRHGALYVAFLAGTTELALQASYRVQSGQWLASRASRPLFRRDAQGGIRVKPNLSLAHNTNEFRGWIYTNSQGFRVSSRHEEYSVLRRPDCFRVVLLGPSFAFGWGVNYEETVGAQLKELLVHWTPRGNKVVAQALAEHMASAKARLPSN